MAALGLVVFALGLAITSALPTGPDPVVLKWGGAARFQYIRDGDGQPHLEDMWLKTSDLAQMARFDPDRQIVYHLFTRQNPTVSQPLLQGVDSLLGITNYNARRRTIVLLHGWRVSATAAMNTMLVPAFLAAEDVNIIVVDWSAGSGDINYPVAAANTLPAARSIAGFINWLNRVTGATPNMYHIIGHSLGAHQAGLVGRFVTGNIAYITALEPALIGFINSNQEAVIRPDDGTYTEVIHTNAGNLGFITPLGQVDFYPNGGIGMPGCNSVECDHAMSYFYMAESLQTGGFTGRRCASFSTAMLGNCFMPGTLRMGGLVPKTGTTGIFHLETNPQSPFSRG